MDIGIAKEKKDVNVSVGRPISKMKMDLKMLTHFIQKSCVRSAQSERFYQLNLES